MGKGQLPKGQKWRGKQKPEWKLCEPHCDSQEQWREEQSQVPRGACRWNQNSHMKIQLSKRTQRNSWLGDNSPPEQTEKERKHFYLWLGFKNKAPLGIQTPGQVSQKLGDHEILDHLENQCTTSLILKPQFTPAYEERNHHQWESADKINSRIQFLRTSDSGTIV